MRNPFSLSSLYFLRSSHVGAEITILAFAMRDLIADLEKTTGNKVRLSLGSSGTLQYRFQTEPNNDIYHAVGRIVV